MALNLAAVRMASHALAKGETGIAARALRALGAKGKWAQDALRRDLRLHGAQLHSALRALSQELQRSLLKASRAPVHMGRLTLLERENQALYLSLWTRITQWLQNLLGNPVAVVLAWLNQDHHLLIVLAVISAALLVFIYLRLGRLIPRGAGNVAFGTAPLALGPGAQWREAEALWQRGDKLAALATGRRAVLTRLDRDGMLRMAPGMSDREMARGLAQSPLAQVAQAFYRAYAYGRWARRSESVDEAWRQLTLLFEPEKRR